MPTEAPLRKAAQSFKKIAPYEKVVPYRYGRRNLPPTQTVEVRRCGYPYQVPVEDIIGKPNARRPPTTQQHYNYYPEYLFKYSLHGNNSSLIVVEIQLLMICRGDGCCFENGSLNASQRLCWSACPRHDTHGRIAGFRFSCDA